MRRLAYLCCTGTLSTSSDRRADAGEHDVSMRVFGSALKRRGWLLEELVWDDRDADLSRFDGAVVGSVWDYTASPGLFLPRLEEIAARTPLANPIAAIEWNLRKTYLRDLETKGAPVIPTIWGERLSDLPALHDALAAEKIVIKPVIGASGSGQFVATPGKIPPAGHSLWTQPIMAQPFQASIHDEGELSFIFFDGHFSHALRKIPAAGEYRVQSLFDGREQAFAPSPADLAAAERVVAAIPYHCLYARIDLVRLDDGQLGLMECELIEPYLFPLFDDTKGEMFAQAVANWLPDG